ncbi:hypothetical protein [Herbaspirillum huttiense]|uniref:hypothetical protein n=1 Tax=Herbaspirillum huttiense TaxID=863372 RepID=UPI002176D5EF|nr:hypothetical protein [Herbaspirillum huttiense]UWE16341.1 hypothetical protein NY669_25260 [Herbaspirillum huttiense]
MSMVCRWASVRCPTLIYMMYLSADWPGLFRRPGTVRYLRRPGATPEQRLDDMIAVLHKLAAPQDEERKS